MRFPMNRNRFLVAAATVGMITATGVGYAQQQERNQPSGGLQQNQGGARNSPAQRNEGGAAQQNRGRGETTGQGQLQNRDRDRSGQAQQNRGRGETTGQGQLQNRDRDQSGQAQQNRERTQQNRGRNETTGQAPQNERREQNRSTEERRLDQNRTNEGATINQRDNRTTTGQGAAGVRANFSVSVEQRTRIHDVIVNERAAPRIGNANFDVRVGTRIPRTVRFVPLPARIIELEPTWRGYDYFLVGAEIIIVDPRTLEIVGIIEA